MFLNQLQSISDSALAIARSIASNYAGDYVTIQRLKYDSSTGDPSDVTPPENVQIPNGLLAQAISNLTSLQHQFQAILDASAATSIEKVIVQDSLDISFPGININTGEITSLTTIIRGANRDGIESIAGVMPICGNSNGDKAYAVPINIKGKYPIVGQAAVWAGSSSSNIDIWGIQILFNGQDYCLNASTAVHAPINGSTTVTLQNGKTNALPSGVISSVAPLTGHATDEPAYIEIPSADNAVEALAAVLMKPEQVRAVLEY